MAHADSVLASCCPNVGVAISAFGSSPFLGDCVTSLISQVSKPAKLVITTSTPNTSIKEISRNLEVPLLVNSERSGIGCDWNFAMSSVPSDYVMIAHQDDVYNPRFIAKMSETITRFPNATLYFSSFSLLGDASLRASLNRIVKSLLIEFAFLGRSQILSRRAKSRLLSYGNPITCPAVIINKRKNPDFVFNTTLQSNLDWKAWLDMSRGDGAFVYVREPLLSRRVHPGSETAHLIDTSVRAREDRQVFELLWPTPIAKILSILYTASQRGSCG